MKKFLLPLSFAVIAAASLPTNALALNTCKVANVAIINGVDAIGVGVWRFEFDQLVVTPGYEACRYFVKWINQAYLPSSANLYLEELMTPGIEDCELNSGYAIPTVVFNSPSYISRGFDKFQMKRTIQALTTCESLDGRLDGVIQFNGGAVYALAVVDP
jgi:hypothetical protein